MGCTALLVVAFLCILQCDLYQATNNNAPKTIVEIIIPPCSIPNSSNQQSSRAASPCNPQLIGGCKSCQTYKGKNKTINKGKQLKFRQSPVSLSIPLNGVKLNIITENIPSCQSNGAKEKPTFNNIENVEVVKVVSDGNGTNDGKTVPVVLDTTSYATVVANDTSGLINETMTANVTYDNATLEIVTSMTYNNSGSTPQDTTVQSELTAENGKNDKSSSGSDVQIDEVPEDNPSNTPQPSPESQNPSAQNPASPNSGSQPDTNLDSSTPSDGGTLPGKDSNNETPNNDPVPPVPEKTSDESPSSSEETTPSNGNNPPPVAIASSDAEATAASEPSA